MKAFRTQNQKRVALVLGLIGIASLLIRGLMGLELDHTALLYVLVPYTIAFLITAYRPQINVDNWWRSYLEHTLTALVVFLGSSLVLMEGFICVVFFMPIYFAIVTIAFIVRWVTVARRRHRSRHLVSVLPLLLLASSLEGTTPWLTLERMNTIEVSRVVASTPTELFSNLASPRDFSADKHWLIRAFPMPDHLPALPLQTHAVHTVNFTYLRWGFTNRHEGTTRIRLDRVEPHKISASVISDTSYFSNYLKTEGFELELQPLPKQQTKVTLRVTYERLLDPAWYFDPLIERGVSEMAAYLVQEMIISE